MMTRIICALWFAFWAGFATADGLPVKRCVNLGNALDAPNEGDWGYRITRQDLNWIAAQGFDAIRLPVRFSAHWDGRLSPALLRRVDQVIAWSRDRGLRVVLDMHHFEELMTHPDQNAQKFLTIWSELAQRYQDYGDELIFELLNEPTDRLTTRRAQKLYDQIIPHIRKFNPDRWIIISGDGWGSLDGMMRLRNPGPNVALSFHYYDPWDFTHQNAVWMDDPPPSRGWGKADDKRKVARDMARAASRNVPVFLGEFGVNEGVSDGLRADWTQTVRRQAEAKGIPWCIWALEANFQLRKNGTNQWRPGMITALFE